MSFLQELIYTLPAVLIAISMHEFAHGYVSYKLGDPTPKQMGRLSLNPLAHLDLMGTLCLLIFHFGWAKPVLVNPHYYKKPKRGMLWVALGGPLMNMLIAFISILGMGIILKVTGGYGGSIVIYGYKFLSYLAVMNLGLGVFNLIPIPPLDGSKILGAILPEDKYFRYMKYEKYGYIAMLILLMINVLSIPLNIINGAIYEGMWWIVELIVRLK